MDFEENIQAEKKAGKTKRKYKTIISWIAVAAVLLIVAGLARAAFYYINVIRSNSLYAKTADDVVTLNYTDEMALGHFEDEPELISAIVWDQEEDDDDEEEEPFVIKEYTFRYTGDWQQQINVDLSSLQAQYPDVKGWLFFENDDISYPIMYSGEDDKYLRTTFDGKYAKAGSIFLEGANAPDMSDSHVILYGHNMRNRSMFGRLKDYMIQPNYYDYHQYFQIITRDAEGRTIKKRYKVFSYFKTLYYSNVYTIIPQECKEMDDLIQYMEANSLKRTNEYLSSTDQVVTLSTCSSGDNRFTVHAYLVDSCVQ